MSHATSTPGVTTHPDAPRASGATTTASSKEAAAQGLVRDEDVRTAAAKALIHTAARPGAIASDSTGSGSSDTSVTNDTTDDAGTKLATGTVASARGAAALSRRLRRLRHRHTTDTSTGDAADDTGDDALTGDDNNNGADTSAPAGDGATDGSGTASTLTEDDTRDGMTHPTTRASRTSHASRTSSATPGTITSTNPSAPSATSPSRRDSTALDVTPRPTVTACAHESAAESTMATDALVHTAQGTHGNQDHQVPGPGILSRHHPKPTTNGARNVTPKATGARTAFVPYTNHPNRTLRANRRRTIERRRVAATTRRSLVTGTPIATTSASATTNTATPATMAVAAPIVVCALVLWAIFMMLMSILVGGAADEDRIVGARHVADVATEAYETGVRRGDYHWKGQLFRDYVGGTTGAWDAAFCSWCLGQAGFVESGLVGRYASVDSFVARFEFNADVGEVHGPDDVAYMPEVGDLLVLWADTESARIEVVTAVSADGQIVTTVSGDAAGGEAGSYDRDADGYGGYVAATERQAHASGTTYLHPHYATDGATSSP